MRHASTQSAGRWSWSRLSTLSLLLAGSLSCTAELLDNGNGISAPPGVLVATPVQFDLTAQESQANLAPIQVQLTAGTADAVSGLSVGNPQFVGPSGWLAASLDATSAPATLTLTPANNGLTAGYYAVTVPIISSTSGNSPQNVIVTLTVATKPVIELSTDTVHFAATSGGANPAAVVVTVDNGGTAPLTALTVLSTTYTPTVATPWLSANLGAATAPTTLNLQATVGTMAAGTYGATVVLQGVGGVRDTVKVQFDVAAAPVPPRIAMVQDSLVFNATSGGNDPNPQVVNITNTGGGTLAALSRNIVYQPGGTGWLSATLGSTTGPTTLTLAPATGQLAPGTYRSTVVVSDPASANTDSVRVVFTLVAPPRIGVNPANVSFSAASGGANPGAVAVNVTNTGGGSVTGLQVGSIAYGAGQPSGWLSATLNGSTAPATITLRATVGALTAGQYTASIPVTSNLGIPGQVVSVTFTLSGGQGAIVGLLGLNQNGFTDSLLPQQVVIRVLDQSSNPVVGTTVGWSPGQGGSVTNATTTTDNNGEARATWRLGPAFGAQSLTVTSGGLTPYVVRATAASAGTSNNPGEPPGFTVLSNRRFDAKTEDGWLDRGDPQFSIVSDTTAPISAPNVGQALFPQGYTGGSGPIHTYRALGQFNKKQMYLSFWFKLSNNFYGGATNGVNKVLHIWINGGSVVVFAAQGQAMNPIIPQMRLQNVQCDNRGISFNLNPNVKPGVRLIRGQWHRIEVLLSSNTPGQPNGAVSWWIDGVQVADYADVCFISSANTNPQAVNWQQVSWNPTYGGPADHPPAAQYMWIDQFYISGK